MCIAKQNRSNSLLKVDLKAILLTMQSPYE